jgi:WD40-like Beta Propeller Repeat
VSFLFGRLLALAPRASTSILFGALLGALLAAPAARAQVAPDLHWQTIDTEHFHVNFGPGLEPVARRAAGSIERAYSRLAKELHEPRGPIELTIGDNLDVSNGYATVFPSNRIVIYARPVVDATSLSFLDDWIDLVVTHELTHIFHLDRSAGWWRAAQYVLGRNPFLFPNLYTPSWLDEGIAVYYESRITGAGRIVGTDHAMIVRAMALDSTTPALNQLSAATLQYPFGQIPYVFGSLLMDYIARTQGAAKMRDFIDASAGHTIPFMLNASAKRGFGVSFDDAFRTWTDSIRRDAFSLASKNTPIRDLTASGWTADRLRWLDSGHVAYASQDGKSLPSLREVSVSGGPPRQLVVRKTLDVTAILPNGARVFAETDFTDPYTLRNDLYVEQNGNTHRLTFGARLMQPDARLAGVSGPGLDIVAVQVRPGSDRLVRVRADRGSVDIAPLTGESPDTIWSEPRWSHDGTRIAATRWTHGAESEIAILDQSGRMIKTVAHTHAVNNAPSWSADDREIYFTSDRSGRSALYRATVSDGALVRIAESATGLFENEPSPDGTQLATRHYEGDGYHIALVPAKGNFPSADSTSVLARSHRDTSVTVMTPAHTYSPLKSMLPKYWLPALEQSDDRRPMFGFLTSGTDAIARHQYEVQGTFEPRHQEPNWNFSYQYAGFGNPVLGVVTKEDWQHGTVLATNAAGVKLAAGTIARRRRTIDIALTELRPRVLSNSYISLGVETEWQDYRTEPRALISKLDTGFTTVYAYPAFFLNAGWSNARQPPLAISPEDGIHLGVSAKQRWLADDPTFTRSTSAIGVASAYKSLNLPGFAHHVLALRVAAGWEDEKSTDFFSAGGISGSTLSIAPGVTVGDPQRTFFARGFPAGVQQGTRALAANLEYRAPISLPAMGLKMLPVFLQRVSAVAYADAASAWCPYGLTESVLCTDGTPRDWMSSAGVELHLDAAVQYDVPYTFRFGTATPLAGRSYFGGGSLVVYFALGLAF